MNDTFTRKDKKVDVREIGAPEFYAFSRSCPMDDRIFRVFARFLNKGCMESGLDGRKAIAVSGLHRYVPPR